MEVSGKCCIFAARKPRLSERRAEEVQKKKLDACDYAGIWSDEEYMDADELVKEIHDARCYNPKRDEFLEKFFTEP